MKSTSSAQSIHFGWATNKLCFSSFLSRKATTMQIYWLEMKWQFIIKSVQKPLQIHYLRLELMVNRRQPMPNRKQSHCKLGTEHRTLKQQCAPVFIITDVPKPISDQMTFKPHFKPIFQAMNSDVICKASHFLLLFLFCQPIWHSNRVKCDWQPQNLPTDKIDLLWKQKRNVRTPRMVFVAIDAFYFYSIRR